MLKHSGWKAGPVYSVSLFIFFCFVLFFYFIILFYSSSSCVACVQLIVATFIESGEPRIPKPRLLS